MQKKWKTTTILGTVLLTGVLAFSTALVAVSCSNNESTGPTPPTEEKYVNNRPARGFYYQYDKPNDQLYMKQMLQYIYNNNPIKDKYLELGYSWPAITNIELDEVTSPSTPIPGEYFAGEYNEPIQRYKDSIRQWNFDIYFEITDSSIQKKQPFAYVYIIDWKFSFTSQKYIDDYKLWSDEDEEQYWLAAGGSTGGANWNAPLQFNSNSAQNVLWSIFDLHYRYANAVDTWYVINQWESSWAKTREQYWDEMVETAFAQSIDWDLILPIK